MKFSTKAKNLLYLKKLNLKKSTIPKFYKFSIKEILENKKNIIIYINKNLDNKISIRSSFFREDSPSSSMAGEFEGYLNVKNNKKQLEKGIKNLINQYKAKSKSKSVLYNSEIIFQNYIANTILSGVVTNKCIKDGSDYYVINYDDTSNLTNTVTSGGKTGGRVLNVFKHKLKSIRSKKFKKIIFSIKELERKIGNYPLDIEFGLNKNKFFIFQVRPLSTYKKWKKINNKTLEKNIYKNQKKFKKIFHKNKDLGHIPSFGLMPDWNPVEMIGYQPDKLSYSLYKKLITDSAWSIARKEMKYKNINRKLMTSFSGKPYIDTRLSFFSYIPKTVNNIISKKIVNFWLSELNKNPFLHDKVEFDIADSCFDLNSKKKIYSKYIFLNLKEKKNYLSNIKKHTEELINNFQKDFKNDKKLLYELENFRKKEIDIFIKKKQNPILLSKRLIKKLIYFGIVPFSKFARHAFIGKKILNSLMDKKLISLHEYSKLLASINTVSSEYRKLKNESNINKNKFKKFKNYFFHLRPGTYDIKTKRFLPGLKSWKIDNFDKFFEFNDQYKKILTPTKINKIDKYLIKNKINFPAEILLTYSLTSMKIRENSKFIFTRTLSDILELIKFWSQTKKISLKNMSSMSFDKIQNISKKKINKNVLKNIQINEEKKRNYNSYVKLPYLVTSANDFYVASILITKPNFITKKIVKGDIKIIKNPANEINIKDKIVLIENADPGYDWVLSQKIKGLITKYGGVNSHMSIRCEELNKAAAIGIGDKNFEEICKISNIILDCKENKINIIN